MEMDQKRLPARTISPKRTGSVVQAFNKQMVRSSTEEGNKIMELLLRRLITHWKKVIVRDSARIERFDVAQNRDSARDGAHKKISKKTPMVQPISPRRLTCHNTTTSSRHISFSESSLDYAPIPESIYSLTGEVALELPPGIAGDICTELAQFEFRNLPALRPIVPLIILSSIASKFPKSRLKYNLYSIVTAPSAAGKEAHQSYLKSTLNSLGYENHVHETPRSDKAIILDLLHASAKSIYVMDEGHVLFRSSFAAKASTYEKNMADLLMQLKTANSFKLTGNLKRDLEDSLRPRIEKLSAKKKLDEVSTKELYDLKILYSLLSKPIPSPHLSLVSYSTPTNINFMFTKEAIATGFIGRFIYLRGEDRRAVLKFSESPNFITSCKPVEASTSILSRLHSIDTEEPPTFSSEASTLLTMVRKYLDDDKNRNHPILGAIFARGVEQILVVSTLLALESRIVTMEMVCYSFKLFMNSIDECCMYLNVGKHNQATALTQIVVEKVYQFSQKHGAASLAVIANHVEKCSSAIRKQLLRDNEFLKRSLIEMVSAQLLIEVKSKYFIHVDFSDTRK